MAVRRPITKPAADADKRTDDADTKTTPTAGRRPARRSAEGHKMAPRAKPEDAADEREESNDTPIQKPDVKGGWGTFKENRAKSSGIPDNFKVEEDTKYVIAFDSEGPFANFRQHWIERPGKKSFNCLENDCPLCDILGDEPKAIACLNIFVFEEVTVDGEKFIEPHVKVWEVGTGVGSDLEKLNNDDVDGPLTKGYWCISKEKRGKSTSFTYSVRPIKERDLEEDWGISPLTDEEFAELRENLYTSDYIKFNTKGELRTIARDES